MKSKPKKINDKSNAHNEEEEIFLEDDECLCDYCGTKSKKKNLARHKSTCIYVNELKRKKSEIVILLEQNPQMDNFNSDRIVKLEIETQEMRLVFQNVYESMKKLSLKYSNDEEQTPEEKIKSLNISENTKDNYLRQWRLFRVWKDKNHKPVSLVSMNLYISSLSCKTTTKFTKRGILQNICRHILNEKGDLNPMRQRLNYTVKYSMTRDDIDKYLSEQKNIDEQMYIIQSMCVWLSIRVGAVAGFLKKHFDFYNLQNNSSIAVKDNKGNNVLYKELSPEFKEELTDYLNSREDYDDLSSDDYVFYLEGKNSTLKRRSRDLSAKINTLIKNSKVFDKSPNFQYSSHMLRKALPNLLFTEKIEEVKKEARALLGHKRGTSSIKHYIDNNENL